VHEPSGVDGVQHEGAERADVRVLQLIVVACVGIGDAGRPLRQAIKLPLVERLHEDRDRPRLGELFNTDELVGGADLSAAMTSWISVTTIGMMVSGLARQVTSPIMPTFITPASICPKPARSP
jgi:hypothetical protein